MASLLVKRLHRFHIPHKEVQCHDIATMQHMIDRIFILISPRALSLFNHILAFTRRLQWCGVWAFPLQHFLIFLHKKN